MHGVSPSALIRTRCILGVVGGRPVVGAAVLLQARVRGGATVAQRARAAAHGGVGRVEVLRALEAVVVVAVGVQPAMTIFPLRVRDSHIPREVSEQEAVQQAHHPGEAAVVVLMMMLEVMVGFGTRQTFHQVILSPSKARRVLRLAA